MPFDPSEVKLGWNHDTPKMMASMPNLGAYIVDREFDLMMEKVPTENAWSPPVIKQGGYRMFLNNTYGDCTIATVGSELQTKTANAGNHMLVVPDADIKKEYFGLTGGADSGLYMDQVMKAGLKPGYFTNDDRYSDKLVAWATFSTRNDNLTRFCMYYFGGVRFGIDLPETAKWQINNNRPWDYIANPTAEQGSNEPGSWGGHSAHAPDFFSWGEKIATWAMLQESTKAFRRNYITFGGVTIDLNWFNKLHKTPITGLALKDLMADMKKYLKVQSA